MVLNILACESAERSQCCGVQEAETLGSLMVLSILACESAERSRCFGRIGGQNIGTSHGFEHAGMRKCRDVPMFWGVRKPKHWDLPWF